MLTKQTNYTNLRQNLASILDEIIEDRSIMVVSRTGKEDVVMLSARELDSIKLFHRIYGQICYNKV